MLQGLAIPTGAEIEALAAAAGCELAGVAGIGPVADFGRFAGWVERGYAGRMGYLTDHRAALRADVRELLPPARSVICVGKLYNGPEPYSTEFTDTERGWIARYAWGEDYHRVLRAALSELAGALERLCGPFEWKICVDTAPVLERSLARDAGLGWIGKNTCLINQARGSWFFLGELITSLPLLPNDRLAADRCGSCARCIEACPTAAIVGAPDGRYEIDSRLCISYLTIELRGQVDEELRGRMGRHVFGCDICQDVCPWNRGAAVTEDGAFAPREFAPSLDRLAGLSEDEFQAMFRPTPVERARYRGFLRNVAIAMGNSGSARMLEPLLKLTAHADAVVAEHASWAVRTLESYLDSALGRPQ
jgi:epoxyqueuosine reductase